MILEIGGMRYFFSKGVKYWPWGDTGFKLYVVQADGTEDIIGIITGSALLITCPAMWKEYLLNEVKI